MSYEEGTKVNGINKDELENVLAQLDGDPELMKETPLVVEAVWEKGVVRATGDCEDLNMVCQGPPEIAVEKSSAPSVREYCPLLFMGCYSITYMFKAAMKGHQFNSFEGTASTTMDMSCFYQKERAAKREPWSKIKSKFEIGVDNMKLKQLKEIGEATNKDCPATETVEKFFVVYTKAKAATVPIEEGDERLQPAYNMENYKDVAEQDVDVIHNQQATLKFICKDEDKIEDHPNALMEVSFPDDSEGDPRDSIYLSMPPPLGPGGYPNPIQCCFFGALAFYMHTIAVRVAMKGFSIHTFTAKISAVYNKRRVLGAGGKGSIFTDAGATIEMDIKSDAPERELSKVNNEAMKMCPSYLGFLNCITINNRIALKSD